MLPQPKRMWPAVAMVIGLVLVLKKPAEAADLINALIGAATTFLNGLG